MPSRSRNKKVTCDNCGIQTTKLNLARQERRCSIGTSYRSQSPSFSTKSQEELKYHFARKHSAPKPSVTFQCELFCQEFPGTYALLRHKNTQHGFSINTANVDPNDIMNAVDDANLLEELRSCQHFFVDSQLDCARHQVFNCAIGSLKTKILDEKFDHFFNNLKSAAKMDPTFRFIPRNIEDARFRYFYAHENNTLLD